MQLTVFASSSSGNCSLIRSGNSCVLIDTGISATRIRSSLFNAGIDPADLLGIFITHEHSDHIKGLSVFLKKTPVPVFAPGTVASELRRLFPGVDSCLNVIEPEKTVNLDGLRVIAFSTPHDSKESVGYRFTAEDGSSVAIATDTGHITDTMVRWLCGADIALIEANHDTAMLRNGPYPVYLKRRILSDKGHLSNSECTWLASVLARSGTRHIVIGHLSEHNNLPSIARSAVLRALEGTDTTLDVAPVYGFLEVDSDPCLK